ncbi:MAG: YebC/PmpR family DNA-binding transcriptional regulator [Anaerolineae bacterium]|nr:YebC/PmpR family DNA-binding transcriptional regulator [Anaerolineae bacterium]
MSGHSKWSTIKRRKGAEDAKRAKLFTRAAKEIIIAARDGGGDENTNPRLKLAIQRARAVNMPRENIERAIKRGTGEIEGGEAMAEIVYEGYGHEGVAFIVEVMTDNKNRTLAEVKNVFNKMGGNLATSGAVQWQFEQLGYITLKGDKLDFDALFMVAAEAGADDVVDEDGVMTVYTPRTALAAVEEALRSAGYEIEESELRWFAKNEVDISLEAAVKNMKLMERLEELDDVQNVATNMSLTEDMMAAYESA